MGNRAPVVVGHARTVGVALAFGVRFAARAVITVGLRTKLPQPGKASVIRAPHLVNLGVPPSRTAQLAVYDTPGPCPHLADPSRFAADVRRLAG